MALVLPDPYHRQAPLHANYQIEDSGFKLPHLFWVGLVRTALGWKHQYYLKCQLYPRYQFSLGVSAEAHHNTSGMSLNAPSHKRSRRIPTS